MSDDRSAPGLPPALPRTPGGSVVTVGTFDGVHLGHQAVLAELRRQAERRNARSVVATFEPHPLRVVRPSEAPALLTTAEEKRRLLEALDPDHIVVLPFTPELSRYTPRRFVSEILCDRLDMRHLVVGHDHGLGRGRSGDIDVLRRLGRELGFGVDVVPAVCLDGEPISSSRIRQALEAGAVVAAAEALGRAYAVTGTVVRGDGRGRKLGFPTANVRVADADKLVPREGIYAARATVGGRTSGGALHLGPRPTFEAATPTLEIHLFDFDADIYGETMRIEFCDWIREIRAFASPAELVDAIRGDVAAARQSLGQGSACDGPEV
ncbi:MAG TPA: bifunctional riboflavin kinase/FAD synthetase [Longimicrobiales bacterium]